MIPVPKLPTDNLYKFMTIFGLGLIAVGAYMTVHAIDDSIANAEAVEEGVAVALQKSAIIESEAKDLA